MLIIAKKKIYNKNNNYQMIYINYLFSTCNETGNLSLSYHTYY